MKSITKYLVIFIILFLFPIYTDSAEILQINSSKSILVGDQNRNLSIVLSCVDVNDSYEQNAVNLLKKEFPRGTKVKIKPVGFEENSLIAKVYNLDETKEMSKLLISNDLMKEGCGN